MLSKSSVVDLVATDPIFHTIILLCLISAFYNKLHQ